MQRVNVDILNGQPDGSFWPTEFDKAIWDESKRLSSTLYTYITVTKNRRIPSKYWLSSLIHAFSSVAYKHKREYNKADFTNFWLPAIKQENTWLNNFSKILYPNKFDRGIGGLRELREKGLVPDLIWLPWENANNYSHRPESPIDKLVRTLKTGGGLVALGIGAFYLAPKIKKYLG